MSALHFRVHGLPAPQGSKRHVGNGIMVESSKRVKPWRQDVKYAALEAMPAEGFPLAGPVRVSVTFLLPRPRAHYGTGKNAATVKATAPHHHGKRPDLDKLLRSTLDALGEAGAWGDDAQVAMAAVAKVYVPEGVSPGAQVAVTEL